MAASFRPLLLALACLSCLGSALGQGPTNLTVVQANSTASISQSGANSLTIKFTPSTLQLTGLVFLNVTDCAVGGLPATVLIIGTNITATPPIINVTASALGSSIGSVSLFNLSLNISTVAFPVNPSNGSYVITISSGTAHVDGLNGTLAGNSFNKPQVDFLFQNQSAAVNGTFKQTAQGLQMTATSTVQIPLSELVNAAGFGSNTLVTSVTSGGSIDVPVNLVATGINPCPTGKRLRKK